MRMIEVTEFYNGDRVLVSVENIIKVEENSESNSCDIYLDMSEEPVECQETYDEVLSKIKETEND